jgi:sulfite exporter TauE/SafE
MSMELVATGFVMGLAGAAHCAAMCGAACLALTRSSGHAAGPEPRPGVVWLRIDGGSRPAATATLASLGVPMADGALALAVFLAARLGSYALGGAAVAAAVSVLATLGQQVTLLRPVWTLLHVALVAGGLWLLATGRQPAPLARLGRRAGRRSAAGVEPRSASLRAAVAGAAWVAVPCGLLQSALVTAALADGPVGGAAVMAAFAASSSAGLVAAPALGALLARVGAGADRLVTRLAGGMLAAASAWALYRLVTAGAASAVCVV